MIDYDGGSASCVANTSNAMWACFFMNLGPALRQADQKYQARFLASTVQHIASLRWSRWPYATRLAANLDSVQSKMLSILLDMPMNTDETIYNVARCRSCAAGRFQSTVGNGPNGGPPVSAIETSTSEITKRHGHIICSISKIKASYTNAEESYPWATNQT